MVYLLKPRISQSFRGIYPKISFRKRNLFLEEIFFALKETIEKQGIENRFLSSRIETGSLEWAEK